MTLDEALAYLTPHPQTGANAPVLLKASTMRTAIAAIRTALAVRPDASPATAADPTSAHHLEHANPKDLS